MLDTLASRWQCYCNTGTAMGFIGTAWRQQLAWQANKTPDGNYKIIKNLLHKRLGKIPDNFHGYLCPFERVE